MKKSKSLKAITLICFVALLSGYVLFKSGYFERSIKPTAIDMPYYPQLENSLVLNTVDTPEAPFVNSTVRWNPTMASTSKSGIVIEQRMKFDIIDLKELLKKEKSIFPETKTDSMRTIKNSLQ